MKKKNHLLHNTRRYTHLEDLLLNEAVLLRAGQLLGGRALLQLAALPLREAELALSGAHLTLVIGVAKLQTFPEKKENFNGFPLEQFSTLRAIFHDFIQEIFKKEERGEKIAKNFFSRKNTSFWKIKTLTW